jgi:hypothetical protein
MLHDMVPEMKGMDLSTPEWRAKAKAIEKANAFFSVSQSTLNDFSKLYPQSSNKKTYLTPNAASDEFRQNIPQEINTFKTKYDIQKPYFLLIGNRLLY